jgi:hypothetical protein
MPTAVNFGTFIVDVVSLGTLTLSQPNKSRCIVSLQKDMIDLVKAGQLLDEETEGSMVSFHNNFVL